MAECATDGTPQVVSDEPGTASNDTATRTKLPPGVLMTQVSRTIESSPTATHRPSDNNLVARAMEQNRLFTSRMPASLQGMRPLVTQTCAPSSMTLTSWLNMQLQDRQTPAARTMTEDSYVINVDEDSSPETATDPSQSDPTHDHHHYHHATMTDNYLNNIREATTTGNSNNNNYSGSNNNNNNNDNDNNNSDEEASVTVPLSPDARNLLCTLFDVCNKYLPYAMILLFKIVYDHKSGILQFLGLLLAFMTANKDVKREIAKQQNGSWRTLFGIILYTFGCFFAVCYIFEETLFRMYTAPTTMWDLLWSVMVTDMILKLMTVVLKVFVTCMPGALLPYQKRGRYYLVMEASSQFYRCTAPAYPWFFYLWDCYDGPEAFIAHLFALAYANNKFSDVVGRGKFLWSSMKKMWQNVSLGITPSKEELVASGSICVICHEEYSNPVLLNCNHIFCETCVTTWLDRERTCPLCRAGISDDPIYRDGHTTDFIQWY